MPYKTIQQNFANGELNPKMQGRSDVDMYYKSAQKMRDVVTTPYGGFVRRPGTTKIGDLTDYYETQGEKNVRLIPFVFNNDQSYVIALKEGEINVYGQDIFSAQISAPEFTKERLAHIKYAQTADTCFFVHPDFKPLKLVRGTAVENPYLANSEVVNGYLQHKDNTTNGILSTNYNLSFSSTQTLEVKFCVKAIHQNAVKEEPINFYLDGTQFGISLDLQNQSKKINIYCYANGSSVAASGLVEYDCESDVFILLKKDAESNITLSYSFDDEEYIEAGTRKIDSFYIASSSPMINLGRGQHFVNLEHTYIKIDDTLSWKYGYAGNWSLSPVLFESIPQYNFEQKDPKKYEIDITPDNMEGTVKFSFTGTISDKVVGQYLEGNGGRLKITKQETNALIGYTVIGFYTKDTIKKNDWSITTNYEPVWSDKRGWPCSVTFHQGRLWFGGSKERPQTVWGSKVGLFNKFDPTAGYDNDAIEFTLDTDTLNKITDLYSMRNLLIFTLGGEFICQTSYNEAITPKNVNATKQTSNGSWENTQPVDMEGSVIFVERRGQALMNFAYLEDETYNSNNASLINSHLINQPEDLDVERNNLTQQTNYVYIVNKDGSMCVVNLLAAQGITGGFTLWNTQGKIKSVCVLPDATYIAVERELQGNYKKHKIFLEKMDWDVLTDCTQSFVYSGGVANSIPGDHTDLMLKDVDIVANGKYLCTSTVTDSGLLVSSKVLPAGTISWGLPFRSYVQSNFLEVAQMGSGVGKLKRLASMVVRVLDTPEVTINGETQKGTGKGVEDIHFYGIGDWDEKPTWEFTQNTPYKFNVLAAQMDLNYQLSTESY